MNTTYIETRCGTGIVRHAFAAVPDSRFLAVLLPGVGYTADRPLLYYAGRLALEHGGDLLRLDYGVDELDAATLPAILDSAAEAIRQAEKPQHLYIVLIGKSYGTIIAGKLMNRLRRDTKLVLFTPVRSTLPFMNGDRFIAFSGTADPLLSMEDIARWFGHSHPNYHLYKDANHSLEIEGDTHGSLEILSDALGNLEDFLWPR